MKTLLLTTLLIVSTQSHALTFKDTKFDSPKAYNCSLRGTVYNSNSPVGQSELGMVSGSLCVVKYDKICVIHISDSHGGLRSPLLLQINNSYYDKKIEDYRIYEPTHLYPKLINPSRILKATINLDILTPPVSIPPNDDCNLYW